MDELGALALLSQKALHLKAVVNGSRQGCHQSPNGTRFPDGARVRFRGRRRRFPPACAAEPQQQLRATRQWPGATHSGISGRRASPATRHPEVRCERMPDRGRAGELALPLVRQHQLWPSQCVQPMQAASAAAGMLTRTPVAALSGSAGRRSTDCARAYCAGSDGSGIILSVCCVQYIYLGCG